MDRVAYSPPVVTPCPAAPTSPAAQRAGRLRRVLPDAGLLALALLQLWPFLGAFHQTADDNFWQFAVLSAMDRPAITWEETRKLAEFQGRIGMFLAMPLVLLGAMMPEYAWTRLLVVVLFGASLLAFGHVLALYFRVPLTRSAWLAMLCLAPMAAFHLPPNSYPLMITLPLLALCLVHVGLAAEAWRGWRLSAAFVVLFALTLMLEYALVEAAGLALIALIAASPGTRRRLLWRHGAVLATAAAVYLGYRLAFPSQYPGNALAGFSWRDVLSMQVQHLLGGIALSHAISQPIGRTDLALAALAFLLAAAAGGRLLPGLARVLPARKGLAILLACAGWAALTTLPHALTPKYQAWCQAGECIYVDSRIAALAAGAALAVTVALALRWLQRRTRLPAPLAWLACGLLAGAASASTLLHNRAAAREMAARERPFEVMRLANCHGWGEPAVLAAAMASSTSWHPELAIGPDAHLRLYAARLHRLGLSCSAMPFTPRFGAVERPGWVRWVVGAPDGYWSVGEAGVLLVAGWPGSSGTILSLGGFVPQGSAPQHAWLGMNGGPACSVVLGAAPRPVFVPAAGGRPHLILVTTPDALSPAEAGLGSDQRRLGARIVEAHPAPPGDPPPGVLDLARCPAD
ncbi:hypothetical protein [Roseomonas sp. AR75]|uniref:hypothetical protein n=1 Tax=Roseomonas sp. AR75 TaxID=2562311 RepID=UPI0010BFF48A|nr:hypothetical protein [Roseomonas sp. AR75]